MLTSSTAGWGSGGDDVEAVALLDLSETLDDGVGLCSCLCGVGTDVDLEGCECLEDREMG